MHIKEVCLSVCACVYARVCVCSEHDALMHILYSPARISHE